MKEPKNPTATLIAKYTLKAAGKEITLNEGEARLLKAELDRLFGWGVERTVIQYVPVQVPVYQPTYVYPQPSWIYPQVWCGTSGYSLGGVTSTTCTQWGNTNA